MGLYVEKENVQTSSFFAQITVRSKTNEQSPSLLGRNFNCNNFFYCSRVVDFKHAMRS